MWRAVYLKTVILSTASNLPWSVKGLPIALNNQSVDQLHVWQAKNFNVRENMFKFSYARNTSNSLGLSEADTSSKMTHTVLRAGSIEVRTTVEWQKEEDQAGTGRRGVVGSASVSAVVCSSARWYKAWAVSHVHAIHRVCGKDRIIRFLVA